MAKKIKNIKLGGVTYQLQDSEITTLVNSLLAMTLPTQTQGEAYWVPTTTDKTQWDNIKVLKFFNLKGSVASFADLPATATTGDVYLIANQTSGFTEEWVKTDTAWELLGTVSGAVDISGKADKSEMVITDGTGANADKVTIQLKQGTSTTVLKTHQDISGKADRSDVTALAGRVSTLENAEHPYLKQIANPDSYEGESGEIIQYKGATNNKYIRGSCYEKKAGEGTGETISSVDESFTITQDNVQYEAGQELDLTGEYRRLRNVVGRLFNTNYSRWINKTPIEAGDEVYDREYGVHHIVTEDEVSDINDNETHTEESYPYVYERVSDGLRLGLWPHEYPDHYSNSEIYVLGNDNTTINSVYRPKGNITIVRGEEFTVEIGTPASWQLIPNPQIKALFDGFTATLISGTTDEYLLTIPQCDNNGSITNS